MVISFPRFDDPFFLIKKTAKICFHAFAEIPDPILKIQKFSKDGVGSN